VTSPTDNVQPEGAWEFDDQVAEVFDDMLARSIPQYTVMREAVAEIARRYSKPGTAIVDLGCSRGEALRTIRERVDDHRVRYVGTEVSEPMLAAAKRRFVDDVDVEIRKADLRDGVPLDVYPSVTVLVLTLQFTPIEYRQRIVQQAYDQLLPGGALVLVEKVLGSNAKIDADFVSIYYELKTRNGYTPEAIERKRLSLEGVLVPVTARWNEELLRMAGFATVDCFWRWMNFAGWVAVKPG